MASLFNTGNEYVSIPEINDKTGSISSFGIMHEGYRANLDFIGDAQSPLISPSVSLEGNELCSNFEGSLLEYWIPEFKKKTDVLSIEYSIFAPLVRRGFICLLSIKNLSANKTVINAGWKGSWKGINYSSMCSGSMNGIMHVVKSKKYDNSLVFELRGEAPISAFNLLADADFSYSIDDDNLARYEVLKQYSLEPGETIKLPMYVGIGTREVSAVSNAREMSIQHWDKLRLSLVKWLNEHTIQFNDQFIKDVLNVHSFYNYFFSQATTLDTENYVLATTKASNNYGCAVYSDKNAMRWTLPAVLQMNWEQARNLLTYGFTTQLRNVGTKSRFIDGTVLESGFILDHLCAPIRALQTYIQLTDDLSILFDRRIQIGVNTIQQILAPQRHSQTPLFETLMTPDGEYCEYPYICYSNALVWRILVDIGNLYSRIRDVDRAEEATKLAIQVKEAILETFVVKGPFGDMFAFAADCNGAYILGDNPHGSLKLLTYFGFCQASDEIYQNTIKWIHSDYNKSNKHDNMLENQIINAANDLLCGRVDEAINFLKSISGNLFTQSASTAGYLAFGLRFGVNAKPIGASYIKLNQRPSESLYQPPPEQKQTTRKARM